MNSTNKCKFKQLYSILQIPRFKSFVTPPSPLTSYTTSKLLQHLTSLPALANTMNYIFKFRLFSAFRAFRNKKKSSHIVTAQLSYTKHIAGIQIAYRNHIFLYAKYMVSIWLLYGFYMVSIWFCLYHSELV